MQEKPGELSNRPKTKKPRKTGAFWWIDLWAIQGSNHPTETAEKPQVLSEGAVKGAANPSQSAFADAIAGIMALPLSTEEKAEAVRRLLAAIPTHKDQR